MRRSTLFIGFSDGRSKKKSSLCCCGTKTGAESEDEEVVNPDSIPLNVIKNDLKENEIANDIEENEIKEVKTILSDDEKCHTTRGYS